MGGAWQGKTNNLNGKRDLPSPRVIAVDVDGTLHRAGEPNTRLIAWLIERKSEGFSLTLWSARGEQHARNMAQRCGCVELFDHIVSKPGYVVDDRGWSWIKYTEVVRFCAEPTE